MYLTFISSSLGGKSNDLFIFIDCCFKSNCCSYFLRLDNLFSLLEQVRMQMEINLNTRQDGEENLCGTTLSKNL